MKYADRAFLILWFIYDRIISKRIEVSFKAILKHQNLLDWQITEVLIRGPKFKE